ncbi:aminotransferase class I/II-fold pyridoxal phosphate-dependent enzyme [Sneathiella glossodoripedis]|uniref:aminotransferase class I/II-fold pyridoxal phosphate-dependent enzyme n=1 Tax=Sneathiella glossodoripedis TaxID=418853 RepID=UPI000472D71B|nr:aminotransferase class I/II-fold pyridoxal phosphate-dependent enzyme [Sneathiella glossodoripedis]
MNPDLASLRNSPFVALRQLLDPIQPAANLEPLALTIGEPQNQPPQIMKDALREFDHLYGKYPPVDGTPELRRSICRWLQRRYNLDNSLVDPDANITPVNGTKEALFMLAQVVTDRKRENEQKPAILIPNPYYHVYHASAIMAGAEPVFLNATSDTNFFPDLDLLSEELLQRTSAFYLCSPSNPQGTVAGFEYLKTALNLARKYDFTLIMDECYAEIYDKAQPQGILEVCKAEGGSLENLMAFHSLSKRSSAAGLRSGFIVGDETLTKTFINLRNFAGAASPLPVCAAAAALWADDTHVEINRALYQKNIDIAEKHLAGRFDFYRPPGGFFLWLNVGDGVEATKKLWREAAIRVLPGEYLSGTDENGFNPGSEYIRVALVFDPDMMDEALSRIANCL